MPASPYVSGAVPVFVGFYSGGPIAQGSTIIAPQSISFLGHTENGLDIQYEHRYAPFRVDLGGEVEADQCYQGTTAIITAVLSRWDDAVYQLLVGPPVGDTLGLDLPGDIGTLVTQEGACTQLVLPFPYANKAAYAAQVDGVRFFSCTLTQDNWKMLGTRPRLLALTWKANRVFVPGVSNFFGYGAWTLFDQNISGLPPAS